MRYLFLCLLLIFFSCHSVMAAAKEELARTFHKANEACFSGNYEEAITLYSKMIADGFENGYIHYNLGNSFFKNGQIGKSIYHYRVARQYIPRNADLLFNLNFVREQVSDKIEKKKTDKILSSALGWHRSLNKKETLILLVFSSAGFWFLWIARLFVQKNWLKWGQILFFILLLLFTTAFIHKQLFKNPFGVIAAKEASVYSSPGTDSVVLFVIHEGVEFTVLDRFNDEWVKIGLDDGKKGWLSVKDSYLSLRNLRHNDNLLVKKLSLDVQVF